LDDKKKVCARHRDDAHTGMKKKAKTDLVNLEDGRTLRVRQRRRASSSFSKKKINHFPFSLSHAHHMRALSIFRPSD
jgi:hypothetical protein